AGTRPAAGDPIARASPEGRSGGRRSRTGARPARAARTPARATPPVAHVPKGTRGASRRSSPSFVFLRFVGSTERVAVRRDERHAAALLLDAEVAQHVHAEQDG